MMCTLRHALQVVFQITDISFLITNSVFSIHSQNLWKSFTLLSLSSDVSFWQSIFLEYQCLFKFCPFLMYICIKSVQITCILVHDGGKMKKKMTLQKMGSCFNPIGLGGGDVFLLLNISKGFHQFLPNLCHFLGNYLGHLLKIKRLKIGNSLFPW